MALTTLLKMKSFLGITSTTQDTQLDALRAAAEQAIKTELDRDLEANPLTEYYSGTGTRVLCLRETPVASISSIHIDFSGYYGQNTDSNFPSSTLLTAGKDYALRIDRGGMSYSGIVERIGTVWSELNRSYTQAHVTQEVAPAIGNIKVSYTAGFTTIPEDIQYCVALVVRRMQQNAQYGYFLASEKLRDYTYHLLPLAKKAISEVGSVERTLRVYKKVPW